MSENENKINYVTRPKRNNELWLTEFSTDNLKLSLRVSNVVHTEKTKYQDLIIVDTPEFGRTLMLDGAFQLTEKDEFCYSEMMAHVPLCAHPNPENVLIIGGGDGAILREVMKHNIKKCYLIDIDEKVIEASKKFLPAQNVAFDDPRAIIKNMDAIEFIKNTPERFDVIIIDSTDPVDFAAGLFQSGFYADIKKIMNQNAMLSELTESPFTDCDLMQQAICEMKKIFPIVKLYWGSVPTYPTGMWTYGIASLENDPEIPVREIKNTKWYSKKIHEASFILPPFLESLIN